MSAKKTKQTKKSFKDFANMTTTKVFVGAVVVLAVAVSFLIPRASAITTVAVYDSLSSTLAPDVDGVNYSDTATSEFGDFVRLGDLYRTPMKATVTMSSQALYSEYANDSRYSGNTASWTHPITIKIYSQHIGTNGVPDVLLAAKTEDVSIPWRPEGSASCPVVDGTRQWKASDRECYSGKAFNATFDLSELSGVILPDDIIVSIAFNTTDHGTSPIGLSGPYNSLRVATPANQVPTIGTDANADAIFWNSSNATLYADDGAAGVGVFRQDTGHSPNGTMAMRLETYFSSDNQVLSPNDKDQCKESGWLIFDFKNQGRCIQYVNTGTDSRQ